MDDNLGLGELEELIAASVVRIAPEQETALLSFFSQEGLKIGFDRSAHELFVGVDLTAHQIVLGTRCLARLWAHVYAYCLLHKVCVQDSAGYEFHVVPNGLLPAKRLLEWALDDQAASNQGRPPVAPSPSCPRPEHRSGTDIVRIVNEVFLCACAYLIHHEVAHVRLGHRAATSNSHQDEFDADGGAADWILSGGVGEAQRRKRTLGIACALVWLYSLQVHRLGRPDNETHPAAATRLQAVMFPRLAPDDPIWEFLVVTMSYHLQADGAEYQPAQFADARRAVVQFVKDGLDAARSNRPPLAARRPAPQPPTTTA